MSGRKNKAGSPVPPALTSVVPDPGTPNTPVGNLAGEGYNATGKEKDRDGPISVEQRIRAQLELMNSTLNEMQAKTQVQKNVSMSIKNGLAKIRESVDVALRECDRLRLPQVTSAEEQTPLNPKRKREITGSSPEQSPAFQKAAEGSDWKRVVARKPSRRLEDGLQNETNDRQIATTPKQLTAAVQKAKEAPKKSKKDANIPKQDGKRNKTRHGRTNAVLIKPAEGRTYVDVLRQVKTNVNPEEANVQIQSCRKTKDGGLLRDGQE